MFIPTSSEFIALCREQVCFLTKGLGAASSVVYLSDRPFDREGGKLVPIAIEPETPESWQEPHEVLELPQEQKKDRDAPLLLPASLDRSLSSTDFEHTFEHAHGARQAWLEGYQVVLPLTHEEAILGFLVTRRQDRPWFDREREQIEGVARTLALACILDRRAQWWEERNQQQQQLHDRQRDLFDNLLHQLRNPLSALKIFGKLLLKHLKPGNGGQNFVQNILRESEHIQELLQQFERVLDEPPAQVALPSEIREIRTEFTRTDELISLPAAGDRVESVALASLLKPAISSARVIASDRQLQLYDRIPSNLPLVRVNPLALREVMNNLIDNALKYTPAGGCICIEAGTIEAGMEELTPDPKHLAIAISDTGLGIPPEDLEHLFERRYRGVQARGDIPGTGLGLAIVRNSLKQMGGQIRVFSPPHHPWKNPHFPHSPPRGTTFVASLPIASV
ncbi:MAG: HAMP domain-containing sensor histidine kinase [Cyanobacteriota bacterium]|nr:HAMP domain-containing sensor histidine kinase [Cyanobacteriota bacterium]